MSERDAYARRVPRSREHHLLLEGGTTRCGLDASGAGWARWPASLMPRVAHTRTCEACTQAARASKAATA